MEAKERIIQQMVGKLEKRSLELDKDASRLNLVNKSEAAMDIRAAVELINSAIKRLSK